MKLVNQLSSHCQIFKYYNACFFKLWENISEAKISETDKSSVLVQSSKAKKLAQFLKINNTNLSVNEETIFFDITYYKCLWVFSTNHCAEEKERKDFPGSFIEVS